MGSTLLSGEVVLVPLIVVLPIVAWHARRSGHGWPVVALRIAFCCWLAALVALAFFPLPLPPYVGVETSVTYGRGWPYPWVSLVPFDTISGSLEQGWRYPAARFLVGNVAAFVPLGFLAPLLSPRWRTWRSAIVLGLGTSLAVEVAQLLLSLLMGFAWRVADVDDLMLNTLGTLLGFGAWWVAHVAVGGRRATAA